MVEPSTVGSAHSLLLNYLQGQRAAMAFLFPHFHCDGSDDSVYPECLDLSQFPVIGSFVHIFVCPMTLELETKNKREGDFKYLGVHVNLSLSLQFRIPHMVLIVLLTITKVSFYI